MAKNTVYDWSSTAASNTDVGGVGITGSSLPSNLDDAQREMMAQIKSWATSLGLSSGDQVARLGSANTFTSNQTISNNGPFLNITDTDVVNLSHRFSSFTNYCAIEADVFNVDATARILFRISGTQVASLTNSGQWVGSAFTTDTSALSSGQSYNGSGIGIGYSAGAAIFSRSGGPAITLNRVGTSTVMSIRSNATEVGSIAVSGSNTTFSTTSDETLKLFDGYYSGEDAIAIILADPVRTWTWVPERGGAPDKGWGAQTSYALSPDLATPGGWFDNDTGEPAEPNAPNAYYQTWGIDLAKRTPYLWAAVAELIARDEAKTQTIADLQTRLAALEAGA